MREQVQLFTAQNGLTSARATLADKTTRHLHSLVDPPIEAVFLENIDFWGDIIVFAGVGLGYHLGECMRNLPGEAFIIVIDYYAECVDYCKKNIFFGLSNRIVFLSAQNANDEAASAFAELRKKPSLKIQIVKHPASYAFHEDYYGAILDNLFPQTEIPESRRSLITPVSDKRSALLMHGHFFLEKEMAIALQANSIDTGIFPYNNFSNPQMYENALMRTCQEKRPSFILSINMKGIDQSGIFDDIARRLSIPVIVWFVDDPRRIVALQPVRSSPPPFFPPSPDIPNSPRKAGLEQGTLSGKGGKKGGGEVSSRDDKRLLFSNFVAACWERAYIPWLQRAGFSNVQYLPLATDPSLFQAQIPASPSISLGFVGTSMIDEYAGNIKKKFLWSNSLVPLVELISDKLLTDPAYDVDGNIIQCAKSLSMPLPFSDPKNLSWLCAYCIHAASMKKRKKIIGGLLSEGIETFGDPKGWKQLLGSTVKTHGDIDYRQGLREVYRGIRTNVNVTSCQMPTAVNQRVFDIPCAGSFVISDNQKDMYELFDVNKEAIAYENLEELKDKIRFFTTHESERIQIITAAQKRILGEHTYIKRLESLLRTIQF